MEIQMWEEQLGKIEGIIENCYNISNIKGNENIGGILGSVASYERTRIVNCYNIKENIKEQIVGSYASSYITQNCYTAIDIFTAEDLGDAFVDDTENVNGGYPLLYWE